MAFRINIIILLTAVALVSCSKTPNELKTAESLLATHPDSSLHILQRIQDPSRYSDANRALYGILLFQALDKCNRPLIPDSLIKISLHFYNHTSDNHHLAYAYYYEARLLSARQQYENAGTSFLKALDAATKVNNYYLLGKISADMGNICAIQKDYPQALNKYSQSIQFFNKAADTLDALYRQIEIARVYRFQKRFQEAEKLYRKALHTIPDSIYEGTIYHEVGSYFYYSNRYDSALYYLRRSLGFPYRGMNYSIRCFCLADLYFDLNQYDSAYRYANKAFNYPISFYVQRDCNRILANTEFTWKHYDLMKIYINSYQNNADSIRKVESQTKISVLEELHQKSEDIAESRKSLIIVGVVFIAILILSLIVFIVLRQLSQRKEMELLIARAKINETQLILRDNLIRKIEENKAEKTTLMKGLSYSQKEALLLELYNKCLQLDNWSHFSALMNQTFNNLVHTLESTYPDLNQKEISWICLFLLGISQADMSLILDCRINSLYKLKQRLVQKMNISSTKELELLLKQIAGLG